jgi:AcrR family transcriptional regulator
MVLTTISPGALKIDGRRQRSERTRLAIILAYLELLRRNPVKPTAAQIADEAGCSTRSIFERFSDLDALSLATADYAITQGQAEAVARVWSKNRTAEKPVSWVGSDSSA